MALHHICILFNVTPSGNKLKNAKILAELVDNKLARHYDLDDSGKKKVRHNVNEEC